MSSANCLTWSVTEGAEVLGVSRGTMYKLIHMDGFPTVRCGCCVRVSKKGLAEWIDRQAEKGWHDGQS